MTDRDQVPHGDEETVVPPPPVGDRPWHPAADGTLLAPPLGVPGYAPPAAVPPAYASPAPQIPPYAAQYAPQHAPAVPAYPAPANPTPSSGATDTRRTILILALVGGAVAVAVIAALVAVGALLASGGDATPSPVTVSEQPERPSPAEPSAPPVDGSDDLGASGTDAGASADIADRLEAKADEYRRLRDSGALWDTIPDSTFNRTAVSAFLYFLTDMKVATIWGVDAATAQQYDERMAMLEERLLAQEPLGDDIRIVLDEGRVFEYDGTTGEGGYTEE